MTPPTSHRAKTVAQRTWRNQLRLRLLRLLGPECSFLDETCAGRKEFAHRCPALRPKGPDGRPVRRSMDETLAEVRANPFLFVVACRAHHHALDGPTWRGQP